MIPASQVIVQSDSTSSWQEEIAQSLRTKKELVEMLELSTDNFSTVADGEQQFPIRATTSYIHRIEKGNSDDPLLKQIMPSVDELDIVDGYGTDPVGDSGAICGNGVLQKYHGRVLLITTSACGIHCRYCFRRHYPYRDHTLSASNAMDAIDQIRSDHTIHEVILSGGDPLMLSNNRLNKLISKLETIPHLQTLRIHSRMAVILPSRIDSSLLTLLKETRLKVVMVIHSNHPNELDRDVESSLRAIGDSRVTLLNQSVLLKGVNDRVSTLESLSHRLFECGVLPYYLHMLDRVQGSHHFEVPESTASLLLEELGSLLPGYLVPKLVREIEGEPRKTPV